MADDGGAGATAAESPQPQRITRVAVTGSRTIEATTFFERTYTVFQLEGEAEGIGGVRPDPVMTERRFAEIVDFHEAWCEPMMSPDRPVFLPPKEPVSFVMKNDAEVVADRVVAIRALPSTHQSSHWCLAPFFSLPAWAISFLLHRPADEPVPASVCRGLGKRCN